MDISWIVAAVVAGGAVLGIGIWVGGMNSFRSTVEPFMREIRADIKEIFRRLERTTSAASPVQLTNLGKKIAQELDTKAWAQRAAPTLAARAAGLEEFEVYELAETYVLQEYDTSDEFERRLRASAYNHSIELEQVRRVLVVELRDALLGLWPGDVPSRERER